VILALRSAIKEMQAKPKLADVRRSAVVLVSIACSFPLLKTAHFFHLFFKPYLLRSWDGSAHFAATYLYDQTIFPDTFGWTHAWFGGMPLPNFYPPLFYWIVAAAHHVGLGLLLALKLAVAIPFLLIPASLGLLSWRVSGRDLLVAACSTVAASIPLFDTRLQSPFPGGLTYASTFNEGLLTQPLGFILLVAWLLIYLRPISFWRHFAWASLAFAAVILASFFCAVAAVPFALAGLLGEAHGPDRGVLSNLPGRPVRFLVRISSLATGSLLSSIWLAPVVIGYAYLATRPLQVSRLDLIPPGPWLWIWFGAALGGGILMLLRGSRKARNFVVGSLGLLLITLLSLSPVHWIPSQPPRLLSTLTFLLAIPVGWLLATLIRSLAQVLCRRPQARTSWPIVVVAAITLITTGYIKPSPLDDAVYTGDPSIASVLDFGRTHHEGRYIVENAWQHKDHHDSRALNAYLGMQGNETLNIVFHEASPSSVFFTPLVNALSASVDSFGISSTLANDLDFYNQAPEQHLRRARQLGVRYVACLTPWIKRRFRQQSDLIEHNLGRWSVFETKAQVAPEVEILRYLPALVVSSLNFKERQSSSYSFVRLSEEQFNDGYSDVLLVKAETNQIEKLSNLEDFGALILETYDYSNEDAAFEMVRRYAQERLVILISSDRPLYARLASHIAELPHALIVRREAEKQSEWLNRSMPWLELGQGRIRGEWKLIEDAVENGKIPSPSDLSQASMSRDDGSIRVQISNTKGTKVPVLVRLTFHPDWVRSDGERIYPATPFFMLTFASDPFEASFRRIGIERAAVVASAAVFLFLLLAMIVPNRPPQTTK
jgi:hypothetical protein